MTEDEAKDKWCPHAMSTQIAQNKCLVPAGRDYKASNGDVVDIEQHCIASECMMWRWAEKRNPDWRPQNYMMQMNTQHPDDVQKAYVKDTKHGFCGLAGRP